MLRTHHAQLTTREGGTRQTLELMAIQRLTCCDDCPVRALIQGVIDGIDYNEDQRNADSYGHLKGITAVVDCIAEVRES